MSELVSHLSVSRENLFHAESVLNGTFDLETLPNQLKSLAAILDWHRGQVMVYGSRVLDHTGGLLDRLLVPNREAQAWHDSGCTLEFDYLQAQDDFIANEMSALQRRYRLVPGSSAKSTVYASPAGKGLPAHFDAYANFVFQISGSKIWRIRKNENILHPTEHFDLGRYPYFTPEVQRGWNGSPPKNEIGDWDSIELKAGQWMFVPIGYWHATEASEQKSLSLNFTLSLPSRMDIVLSALRLKLVCDETWRRRAETDHDGQLQRDLVSLLSKDPDDVSAGQSPVYDTYQQVSFLHRQLSHEYW